MVDLRPLRFRDNKPCRAAVSSAVLSISGGAFGGSGGAGGGGKTTGFGGGGGGGGLGIFGGLKNDPMCKTPMIISNKLMKYVQFWQSHLIKNVTPARIENIVVIHRLSLFRI